MSEIHERQPAPARHRLNVSAYFKRAEAEILTQNLRVEPIGGKSST